jgi:dihydrofolate synthase/folylpolyglutamate synthase
MHVLLDELGHPERVAPAVHVVGTNGKSSTVRFCAAALRASGVHVGAYLSPHVLGWEERVQLDGEPITPGLFDQAVVQVQAAAPAVERAMGEGPTQFEAVTAAAFLAFAGAGVERLVVEAGLGGRHDASNVLAARVVGLTSIGLDHTEVLGDTRELILAEKLAVLTPGSLLLAGEIDDELWPLAAELAHEHGALGARRMRPDEVDRASALQPAHYQAANAALGLELARVALAPDRLDEGAAAAAVSGAAPPGRLELELEPGRPAVLLDGAHNADGMRALVVELDRMLGERRPRVAVVGLQASKSAAEMLGLLAPHVDALVATDSGHAGSLHPAVLALAAEEAGIQAAEIADPLLAVEEARTRAGAGGAVIVAGSLYLLARLRRDLRAAQSAGTR